MKKIISALCVLIIFGGGFFPADSQAAVADWQQGVSVQPYSSEDFGTPEMKESLQQIKSTGATHVVLIIPHYQNQVYDNSFHAGSDTPSDAALLAAISSAHDLDLKVWLKFHMFLPPSLVWGAYINPSNRDVWFSNYESMITHYVGLTKNNPVEGLVIGTELINLTNDSVNATNTAHWKTLISHIRGIYPGKLTYSPNWGEGNWYNEKVAIGFWDDLDYLGTNGYYRLTTSGDTASLKAAWQWWYDNDIHPWQQKYNKPVLFTEAGYRSMNNAHYAPWDWQTNTAPNMGEQANDYEAFFSFWNQHPEVVGAMMWSWDPSPLSGGSTNNGFTPQNKPAQDALATWYGGTPRPTSTSESITFPFRMNAGGIGYTDSSGNQWQTDVNFSGGQTYQSPEAVASTSNSRLYQSERYADASKPLIYTFSNVPNGDYNVTLKFAEIYWNEPGKRVFSGTINGGSLLSNFDILKEVGGKNIALDKTFLVHVTDGRIGIQLQPIYDRPKLSGLEIVPVGFVPTPTQTPTPVPPITSSSAGSFTASASSTALTVGQASQVSVDIKGTGESHDVIADLEIYNQSNSKVYQQFFEHQSFTANVPQHYSLNWTPAVPGNYILKFGIFKNDWSQTFFWENNASKFSVTDQTAPTPTPTPTPSPIPTPTPTNGGSSIVYVNGYPTVNGNYIDCYGNVDNDMAHHSTDPHDQDSAHHVGQNCPSDSFVGGGVQPTPTPTPSPAGGPKPTGDNTSSTAFLYSWPIDGQTLQGLVTFRAKLNIPLDQYSLYWQVDGDRLNSMDTKNNEKESDVDVSSWSWRGNGPYQINFVAKKPDGTTITSTSTSIRITR